jgi:hypothetical protein
MNRLILLPFIVAITFLAGIAPGAAEMLKPFILASTDTGNVQMTADKVAAKLETAGFKIAGRYSPFPTAVVIGVTNDTLRKAAARSSFGGYVAAQRVSVTEVDGKIQVAFTNPEYMANAYRLSADLGSVRASLAAALGNQQQFGPADGMTADDLREYHYMFGMEYFDEPSILARYASQPEAIAAVEAGLARGASGVTKVWRIDVAGKAESVFGVAMKGPTPEDNQMDDAYLMSEIDFKKLRSTAHLPYEMLVSDGVVYALYARFRIAINFPDLAMMGSHSFMNIMGAPGAIEAALMKTAGGKIEEVENSTSIEK